MSEFVVFKSSTGDWRWHLTSRNGEVVAQGEGYVNKTNAMRGVSAVKRNVLAATGPTKIIAS
jgi:uncharacterized protein YegP (UPF0339 family)